MAAAQPMKPMSERSTLLSSPSVLMSEQSRPGPKKPVEETTTSLPISLACTPASFSARAHTSVTSGTATSLNLSSLFSTGMRKFRSSSKKLSSPSRRCSGVKSGTAM